MTKAAYIWPKFVSDFEDLAYDPENSWNDK